MAAKEKKDKDRDLFQRYLDAGIAFTNMTRERAEELVEDLIKGGELQGADARARVEDLLERSRRGRQAFVDQVRHEVGRQLEALGISSLEDLARQVADVLNRTAETGRQATKKSGGKKATAKKKSTKKSGAGAKAAKKPPAKKPPAKKAATKKAPARTRAPRRPATSATTDRGRA